MFPMQMSKKEKSDLFHNLSFFQRLDLVSYVPGIFAKLKYLSGSKVEVPDLSKTNQDYANLIHLDVHDGNTTLVPLYQKLGVDINAKDGNGLTPIMLAAFHCIDGYTFLKLIEFGANLNISDNQGDALIHRAINEGRSDIVHLLLQFKCEGKKLDLKQQDMQGNTPLMLANQSNLPQHLINKLKELTLQPDEA